MGRTRRIEERTEALHLSDAEYQKLVDAHDAVEAIIFVGTKTDKDIARYVALNSCTAIAEAWSQKSIDLPSSAQWWIDNKRDICAALLAL